MRSVPGASPVPTFSGPTPPDRVEMTVGEHYAAILAKFRAGGVMGEELMETRAFFEAFQKLLQQQAGEAGAGAEGEGGGAPVEAPAEGPETSQYGTSQGTSNIPSFGG